MTRLTVNSKALRRLRVTMCLICVKLTGVTSNDKGMLHVAHKVHVQTRHSDMLKNLTWDGETVL